MVVSADDVSKDSMTEIAEMKSSSEVLAAKEMPTE